MKEQMGFIPVGVYMWVVYYKISGTRVRFSTLAHLQRDDNITGEALVSVTGNELPKVKVTGVADEFVADRIARHIAGNWEQWSKIDEG